MLDMALSLFILYSIIYNAASILYGIGTYLFSLSTAVPNPAALRYFQESYRQLKTISQILNSDLSSTGSRVQTLLDEKLALDKENSKRLEEIAVAVADSKEVVDAIDTALSKKESVAEVKLDYNKQVMRKAIGNLTSRFKKLTVIMVSSSGDALASRGSESDIAAIDSLKKRFGARFKGGGSKDYAEGRIDS